MTGVAYLVSSGPSAEMFDWSVVRPDDFILAVNFSGLLCPRFNAVVAIDVDREGIFGMYQKDVLFFVRNKGKAVEGFTNVKRMKTIVHGAGRSGAAFGLFVLHRLGFKNIVAVGCDTHTTGKYSHARKLIDLGLYEDKVYEGGDNKVEAVNETARTLKLNVTFFSPGNTVSNIQFSGRIAS
jgi:hypothetical protein